MDNNKLQEEMVVAGKELCNILNFHDFVLEESKKDKKETKKSKPAVKDFEEFADDTGDDVIDPNDNPKRYIKLREQFIKEELQ